MKKELYFCDICKKEAPYPDTSLQVIFITEQTEGNSCNPHLDTVTIDLCNHCMQTILDGNYVFASGAQGSNEYFFKEK